MSALKYTNPCEYELNSILIYGSRAEKSVEVEVYFMEPSDLIICGSLEEGCMYPTFKENPVEKEGYIKTPINKLLNIKVIEVRNFSIPSSLNMNLSYYQALRSSGIISQLGTQRTQWDRIWGEILDTLREKYSNITGISFFDSKIQRSDSEGNLVDYSYMYPYTQCSFYLGSSIFNCYFYCSGTLVILGHQVEESDFDYEECANVILDAFSKELSE